MKDKHSKQIEQTHMTSVLTGYISKYSIYGSIIATSQLHLSISSVARGGNVVLVYRTICLIGGQLNVL